MSLSISYSPPGPVAQNFCDSTAFVRALLGPVGSGKSVCGFLEIVKKFAERTPDSDGVVRARAVIIRNTYGMLKSATLPTIQKWWPEGFGKLTVGTSPMVLELRTKSHHLHIDMLALDQPEDIRKLLSTEWNLAWIDEAKEVDWEIMMVLVSRIGRQPASDKRFAGITVTSNMSPTEHWLCKKFTVEKVPGWELFLQPGGRSKTAENLKAIGGLAYYDRIIASADPDYIKVFVDAEWGHVSIGAAIFPQYIDSVHTSREYLVPLANVPLLLGLDFGLSPSCVIMQQASSGQYLVLDEMTSEDRPGIVQFAEAIRQHISQRFAGFVVAFGTYDPAGNQRNPVSEKTQVDLLKSVTGYKWVEARSNIFADRREVGIAVLTRMIGGAPGVLIDPRCHILREALAGKFAFRVLRNAAGLQTTSDPIKNHPHSDCADAWLYNLMGSGEYLALVEAGRPKKASKHEGMQYDIRIGKWWDPIRGQYATERTRQTQARGMDYDLFEDRR